MMSHLTPERLAALLDETPTPVEAAHLASCDACTAEIAAQRRLARLAVTAGVAADAPVSRFEGLRPRLVAEGLLREPRRRAVARAWILRAAASLALAAGGAVLGRITATTPAAGSAGSAGAAATGAALDTPAAFGSVDDAMRALAASKETYQNAAAFLAAQDTGAHFIGLNQDTYRARLQALDDIAAATRAALYRAPQDPVLNQYYLDALSAREATIGQLRLATSGARRMQSW
jgi:hypothetical protein